MNVRFPDIIRPFLGKLIWRKNPSSKVIYVTFDDGPVPEVTPRVLDLLDKFNVKATFFCVGENVQKHPDIYAEMIKRGHKTGNHTFNHLKGLSVTNEEYVANIEKAAQYIDSKLFRPPYGQIKRGQRKKLQSKYDIVMWDLITHDYNQNLSKESIFNNIKHFSRNGSIVVFHDSIKAKNNMLYVLPLAIEYWNSQGFTFDVL
ncbi:MAG: polysaccharide deacetylase family protein [Paludibacter sp.]|nr:polysaccharide deacetylase family protein [Paludibacter sp.]